MTPTTTRAVAMPQANPVISALMMLSLAVYVACCGITLLAALAGRETHRAPLMTGEPIEIRIEPQRAENGPEIKHGATVLAMGVNYVDKSRRIGGVR